MPKKQPLPKRDVAAEVTIIADGPAETCVEQMREAYAIMKTTFGEVYQMIKAVESKQTTLSINDLVDIQFCCREASKLADDIRKQFNAMQELQAKLTCAIWTIQATSGNLADEDKKTIKGQFCSGTPDMKVRVRLPTFDNEPERYKRLMDWLDIKQDLQDKGEIGEGEEKFNTEIVRVHYPGFQCYIDAMIKQGYALPDFIDPTNPQDCWTEAVVRLHKTQDLL